MKSKYIFILFLLLILINQNIFSQINDNKIYNSLNINLNTGFQKPFADMKNRFGNNQLVGAGVEYQLKKNKNILVGIGGTFFFGNVVKEDPLINLRTPEGEIIGNNKQYADLALRERGFNIQTYIGKLFNIDTKKMNFIRTDFGVGFLQHKIRLQDNTQSLTQIIGDYAKGYDRLTNGISLTQLIGYQHIRQNNKSSFLIGMECTEAFTKSRRDWDFATFGKDNSKRLDVLLGVKIAWTLHFNVGVKASEIYY